MSIRTPPQNNWLLLFLVLLHLIFYQLVLEVSIVFISSLFLHILDLNVIIIINKNVFLKKSSFLLQKMSKFEHKIDLKKKNRF